MRLNSIFDFLPAGSTLADSKDRLISTRIKQELNTQFARYGQVLEVKLNTRERCAELSLSLKGEPDPISVNINKYAVIKENGQLWLTIDSKTIEASREWLTLVLQDQAGFQRLPIPQKYAWLVTFLG
ncbi:MAG: hypothetical protein JOZ08_08760 [Verrucomicrobia bacterium]|nr:hypothetical protein [Verrucomicrobiota bacterium]MBV8278896.1 hypothetical protein [Verrucomicrobiota bacterium]